MGYESIKLDDLEHGPEFSTRIMSVAARHGCRTMGDLKTAFTEGRVKAWKGLGSKSLREIKETLASYEDKFGGTPDIFAGQKYSRFIFEDRMSSAFSSLAEATTILGRIAVSRRASKDTKEHVRSLLSRVVASVNDIHSISVGEE